MKDILLILLSHFVADFIMQSDKQAIEKSKSNYWLTIHVSTYTCTIMLFAWTYLNDATTVILWASFNGAAHWIQDYITSRINSRLYKQNKRHWFFVGIGADQLIHYCCLLLSYEYLSNH